MLVGFLAIVWVSYKYFSKKQDTKKSNFTAEVSEYRREKINLSSPEANELL